MGRNYEPLVRRVPGWNDLERRILAPTVAVASGFTSEVPIGPSGIRRKR